MESNRKVHFLFSLWLKIFLVKAPTRRATKNIPAPPALEDSEAWPSPDVAATVEKEDRVKSTPTLPQAKEAVKEATEDVIDESFQGICEGRIKRSGRRNS